MKQATSKDVAKVVGVNQSTVSLVFSGVDGVGAATPSAFWKWRGR
jgi:DNA-binding LacI/PurR family transcriptional regulator